MRRLVSVPLAALLLAGCDEGTSPSLVSDSYALARIGVQTLPIPQGPDGGAPFLIADSLRLDASRPREDLGRVLRKIQVVRDADGTNQRMVSEHSYAIENGVLTYDSCPREFLCAASLVYAPLTFLIVGDSLFQIGPEASPVQRSVYGRVRREF